MREPKLKWKLIRPLDVKDWNGQAATIPIGTVCDFDRNPNGTYTAYWNDEKGAHMGTLAPLPDHISLKYNYRQIADQAWIP